MYKGGCLCGKIHIKITSAITDIYYCHCSQCRKAQGSASAVNGNVSNESFIIVTGVNSLSRFQINEKEFKFFCKHCGSPIYNKDLSNPKQVRIRLGILDSVIREKPSAHIYADDKADWEALPSSLPIFSKHIGR